MIVPAPFPRPRAAVATAAGSLLGILGILVGIVAVVAWAAVPAVGDEAASAATGIPPVSRRADAASFEQVLPAKAAVEKSPRAKSARAVPSSETAAIGTASIDATPERFEPAGPRGVSRPRSAIVPAATPNRPEPADAAAFTALVARLLGGRSLDAAISASLVLAVASLAPAVLLMTTCFVRMSIVLALVRQGLGTPNLPSNQILTSLALFLSALVMWPVWTAAYREGVEPYQQGRMELAAACDRGSLPVRRWMAAQIEQAGNRETMLFFLARHPAAPLRVATYDDVPVETLLPAFLVSELKAAFAIGFRLLLPFLVLDVLVATLVVSTGLVMLPPTLVSLPLKLLVFVAADGWSLVVRALLDGMRSAV
jgi:flagellar biosynthetic protein FliP